MSLIPVIAPSGTPVSEVHARVEAERQRVIEESDKRGEFWMEVDGFVYFWPRFFTGCGGFLSAHQLRWIADELDRRNEAHEREIAEYFEKHPQ